MYISSMAASWAIKYICIAKHACTEITRSSMWFTSQRHCIGNNYNLLRGTRAKIRWNHYVWNRFSVPKHRIICWLAIHDRLKTKARLFPLDIGTDILCGLCGLFPKTFSHLFFECKFSRDCCTTVLQWMGFRTCRLSLILLLHWIRRYCPSSFRRRVAYAVISGVVYYIWSARNSSVWDGAIPTIMKNVQKYSVLCKKQEPVNS